MFTKKTSSSSIIHVYIILFVSISIIDSFNIDTQYPIVFTPPVKNGQFFGYALSMFKTNSTNHIYIGAPRARPSIYNNMRTGALYSCSFKLHQTTCDEVKFESGQYQSNCDQPIADEMFLGGSMSYNQLTKDLIVCGFLWTRHDYQGNFPGGSCFVLHHTSNQSRQNLCPLLRPDFRLIGDDETYPIWYYSSGSAGFSIHYSANKMFLGAPGWDIWKGGLLIYNITNDNQYKLIRINTIIGTDVDTYTGFSVTTGQIFHSSEVSIIVSAPRAGHKYQGSIFIYQPDYEKFQRSIDDYIQKDGSQMGENFGSALITIDLDDDGFDEIIVSAPNYVSNYEDTKTYDQGRIYVYKSDGQTITSPYIIEGSGKSGARFGTSLASIGDIDGDGYKDFAVGAPYEDDRSGVVYIYTGGKTTKKSYHQRISAIESLPHLDLEGFGFSISSGEDIDDNNFNDLLIGSYLSDEAILLRTSPVATLSVNITISNNYIDFSNRQCDYNEKMYSCFNVTACYTVQLPIYTDKQSLTIGYESTFESPQYVKRDKHIPNWKYHIKYHRNFFKTDFDKKFDEKCIKLFTVFMVYSLEPSMKIRINFNQLNLDEHQYCEKCAKLKPIDDNYVLIRFSDHPSRINDNNELNMRPIIDNIVPSDFENIETLPTPQAVRI